MAGSIANFPGGVASFGVPVMGGLTIPTTTGQYLFVDSTNGSDGNLGDTPTTAKATIGGAQSAARASKGDVVVVMPGYAETRTTAITLSKAGVSYVGLGEGMLRPAITGNGTIDAIDITAANITIDNFSFPAPSTDDQTSDINVGAAGVTIRNTYHIGSTTAKNKTDIITVASGGDDLLVENVRAYNTVVDCVSWLSLEAAVARPVIRNCYIAGQFSTAVLMDEATATLAYIRSNTLKNTKAATAVANFTNNSTGVCSFNHMSGRHTTIASNLVAGTGMDFFENRVVEEAAVNGMIAVPTVDVD